MFDLILYVPDNIFTIISGWVFLLCFAEGHNAGWLEPATPLSRVKYSTTEQLCSRPPAVHHTYSYKLISADCECEVLVWQ